MLLPVLFFKPGLAVVPVMRLSLVTEGGGAPHQSIRKPLEVLDQTHSPANVSILAKLLPQHNRIDCYTATYLFPPPRANRREEKTDQDKKSLTKRPREFPLELRAKTGQPEHTDSVGAVGKVECEEFLGGLLKSYRREAA